MKPAEKVLERGHWFVTVRPLPYREARIEGLGELESILRRSAVRLRGWDYPHFSNRTEILRQRTYIEHGIDWQHYVEYWRFYKSGQFAFWQGVRDDWRDQSTLWPGTAPADGSVLGVIDAVYTMRELFTFAAHLAVSPAGSEEMVISAALVGAQGRRLYVEPSRRSDFDFPRSSRVPTVSLTGKFEQGLLVSASDDLALEWCRELFTLFHWDPSQEVLEDLVAETRAR